MLPVYSSGLRHASVPLCPVHHRPSCASHYAIAAPYHGSSGCCAKTFQVPVADPVARVEEAAALPPECAAPDLYMSSLTQDLNETMRDNDWLKAEIELVRSSTVRARLLSADGDEGVALPEEQRARLYALLMDEQEHSEASVTRDQANMALQEQARRYEVSRRLAMAEQSHRQQVAQRWASEEYRRQTQALAKAQAQAQAAPPPPPPP
eukprot:RCo005785